MNINRKSSSDPVYRWLSERGFWVYPGSSQNNNNSKTPLTHVFLNGGKASVPDAARPAFHRAYSDAILSGVPQYAVERVPSARHKFRMFVDLDIKPQQQASTEDDLVALVPLVTRVVLDNMVFRDNDEGRRGKSAAVVAIRRHLSSRGQQPQLQKNYKAGAHIVWDGVHVDGQEARRLRDECVRRCEETAPHLVADWSAVIDSAVYNNNGLRMVLSRKKDSHAVYVPAFEWTRGEQLREVVPDEWARLGRLADWVDRFSIHVPAERSFFFENPPQAPTTAMPATYGVTTNSSKSVKECDDVFDVFDDAETGDLLAELREMLRETPFRSAPFCQVRTTPRGASVFLNSRYCANLGGQHRSNRVYLLISDRGVHQGCTCSCDTTEGRRYGRCCDVRVRLTTSPPLAFTESAVFNPRLRRPHASSSFRDEENKRRRVVLTHPRQDHQGLSTSCTSSPKEQSA